jgi:hypothetical protein
MLTERVSFYGQYIHTPPIQIPARADNFPHNSTQTTYKPPEVNMHGIVFVAPSLTLQIQGNASV